MNIIFHKKSSFFRKIPRTTLRGHVDECVNSIIRGWAWDTSRPNESIIVEARAPGQKSIIAVANEYRADLENSGFGNGRHGFKIDASEWSGEDVSISLYFEGTSLRFGTIDCIEKKAASLNGLKDGADSEQEWAWNIDDISRVKIDGWIVSRIDPSDEVIVFVKSRTGKKVSAIANMFRGDLVGSIFNNSKHAFSIDVSKLDPAEWPLDLFVFPSNAMLNKSPLKYGINDQLLSYNPEHSIKAQFKSVIFAGRNLPDVNTNPHAEKQAINTKTNTSIMFDIANPNADKEGLISKFLQYESFRIDREKYEHSMNGTLQERIEVLMWYLIKYLRDRQYKYVLPLSSKQIDFLNSPMPVQGFSPAVTIVFYNFIKNERPDLLQLDDPQILRQAVYWWCCERTPRDKTDSLLITSDQAAILLTEEQWVGEPFPFNVFMAEHFSRDIKLHSLNMHKTSDRAVYFYYLTLSSKLEPFILRFLPKESLRAVLGGFGEGEPKFDDVVGRLSGLNANDTKDLSASIEKIALSVKSSRLQPSGKGSNQDSGECYVKRKEFSEVVEPGVALIGPLYKTSGLGQATRLSYATLKNCELVKPTGLSFELDNPAPVGFTTSFDVEAYNARREINLIHLNAESVPLLYAFAQSDIVANSYNIGYFFWELNMIPKCHYLALDLLDEIWVSSEYNREIYSRYTRKPVINVGMAVEELPRVQRVPKSMYGLRENDTIFLTTFDSFSFIERKNPMGVLEAFSKAFPVGTEPVQLILKTQNRGRVYDPYQIDLWRRIDRIVSDDPRIVVINETYHYKDLLALKQACDCYVSLHRAEGWGFGMIEAMQLGKPVVATSYSGNMDFCNADTAYLVDYDLIGVREAEYIFVERGSQWAQPNITHAAARMREVAADRVAAEAKGAAAAKYIKANFSVSAIAARYAARLAIIRSENFKLLEQRSCGNIKT